MPRPACLLLLLLGLPACRSVAPRLSEPALPLAIRYEQHPWLAALLPAPASPSPLPANTGIGFAIKGYASRELLAGPKVADLATAIASQRSAPFPGSTTALQGLRWITGEPAAEFLAGAASTSRRQLQHRGDSNGIACAGLTTITSAGEDLPQLWLTADGEQLHLLLQLPDGELVVLPNALQHGAAGILAIPPASSGAAATLLAIVTEKSVGPTTVAAVQAAAARPTPPPPPAATVQTLARTAIGTGRRRPALLALAREHQLPEVVDFVLTADDEALRRYAARLPAAAATDAWPIAAACLTTALELLRRDQASPGLTASLRRWLGALALDPGELEFAVLEASNREDFQAVLHEENLRALADRRGAVRLCAAEWLRQHGIELPGYDALAPQQDREAALAAYQGSLAASRQPAEVGR